MTEAVHHLVDRSEALPTSIVLTGASGWFGLTFLDRLAQLGIEPTTVRALVGSPDDVTRVLQVAPNVQVHVGDVADPGTAERLLKGAQGADVVHAAGTIHPSHVEDFHTVNVVGTANVVTAAERHGVRRFVHISSNSPFGVNARNDDVFRADEPYRPYLGYGTSKMEAELLVRGAHERRVVDTVILRPAWFYGPWQPPRQSRFFTMVRKGRLPIVGDGKQRRSMTYTHSLVDAVQLARLRQDAGGTALWVADERPYPMTEIIDTVRRALAAEGVAVTGRVLHVPTALGRLAERGDRMLQSRGTYVQELHVLGELDKTIACDISRTRSVLGYEPRTALFDGMRTSIRWCLDRGVEV